jgi:hypothetical protein
MAGKEVYNDKRPSKGSTVGAKQTTVGRRWYLKSLDGEPHLQARQVQSAQGGDRRRRGKVRWQPRPAQAAGGARRAAGQDGRDRALVHSDESAGGAAATDRAICTLTRRESTVKLLWC